MKRNYRNSNTSKEVVGQNEVEELGPDFEELEGKPIQPEYIDDALSSSSSENNFEFKKVIQKKENQISKIDPFKTKISFEEDKSN